MATFTSGQDGGRFENILLTRFSSKIRSGPISGILQSVKSIIFANCGAFNPKVHN